MDTEALSETLEKATAIAQEAGLLVANAFPNTALDGVGYKGDVNPVTETDRAAEALIVLRIQESFPNHRVLAEEGGGDPWHEAGPPIWVIDPLDGTNNFAHGFPHVAVSLALLQDGVPLVGVVHDPLRGETFAAALGEGAMLDGKPIRVASVAALADALVATGFPYDRRTAADNNAQRVDHFVRRSQGVRRAGSAALDLAYVACGRLGGFWEIGLRPWDVAAAVLLIREAGGSVTDFRGGEDCLSGESVVASNGRIHEEMLRVIAQGAGAPLPAS